MPSNEIKPVDHYKVRQVAGILGVSVGTVRSYINRGELPAYRLSEKGDWRIPASDFKIYVNKRFGLTGDHG